LEFGKFHLGARIFSNGTLQIGSPVTKRNLSIGYGGNANMGEFTIATGATLNAYLNTVTFGGKQRRRRHLGLARATVAGGVLDMTNLIMCLSGNGGIPVRNMFILMDDTTGITELKVRGKPGTRPRLGAAIHDPRRRPGQQLQNSRKKKGGGL